MPFWELASSLNSKRSQVIFQVGYYCSCGSRIMKLNRIIGLNIWLEGWYREKSMKGSTKTTERWVFLQSAQKKSIGQVCKLKKRGRGTIGKKSKQRGEKILTKSESLKKKKAVDCICCHSTYGSWETAIRGAVS